MNPNSIFYSEIPHIINFHQGLILQFYLSSIISHKMHLKMYKFYHPNTVKQLWTQYHSNSKFSKVVLNHSMVSIQIWHSSHWFFFPIFTFTIYQELFVTTIFHLDELNYLEWSKAHHKVSVISSNYYRYFLQWHNEQTFDISFYKWIHKPISHHQKIACRN